MKTSLEKNAKKNVVILRDGNWRDNYLGAVCYKRSCGACPLGYLCEDGGDETLDKTAEGFVKGGFVALNA